MLDKLSDGRGEIVEMQRRLRRAQHSGVKIRLHPVFVNSGNLLSQETECPMSSYTPAKRINTTGMSP